MRAFLCVLDSFGIGQAEDAPVRDRGADTFGHIARLAADGRADREGLRQGPLKLPNLSRLGLTLASEASTGAVLPMAAPDRIEGLHGYAVETSRGTDTPSGHWEMLGLPVDYDWGYFPETNSFPPELTDALIARGGLPGLLGNRHASGTTIIEELGEEHLRTGKPILYTSADSVLQIAAHEEAFGLERLYALCAVARALADPYRVGRVIARPFTGADAASFKRTKNRRDFATPPHGPTLLDVASGAGRAVIAMGKVPDIFAHSGVTTAIKAGDNLDMFKAVLQAQETAPDGALVVANFNDFDSLYGHRRDIAGYAAALETFDAWLPAMRAGLKPGDVMVISADHGCDPTWAGSDHTREHVPVLAFGPGVAAGDIGRRDTFADIGQSLAQHLNLPPLKAGRAFL